MHSAPTPRKARVVERAARARLLRALAFVGESALATKLDVCGTPTSFVDGRRVEGAQSDATFEEALR